MRSQRHTKLFLYTLVLSAAIVSMLAFSCKKKTKVYYVSAQFKADFAFHPGSYWIYRDSLTGYTDSAYVVEYVESTGPSSCVDPVARREYITMTTRRVSMSHVDTVAGHDGVWRLTLVDNNLYLSGPSDEDSITRRQSLLLGSYPFAVGPVSTAGCAMYSYVDSGYVSRIVTSFAVEGNAYANTAISEHTNIRWSRTPDELYNDVMYLSPRTGIVKAIINHIPNEVHRVWELQRYHIE